ncbi:Hsp20/alpha crystallin family protein [Halobiforma nitratireducens]|uniref:Heat shock protein Hsp20 n=1 Tax=Halobiforma nitratireducens JCM 10879 TaxID=1227454 RepID=M0L194_9EURY|nr:Hsp20/alpha crystallin family protein [Halobiforma nitratireducens]EMA27332.1 heat shock protein Hsp20 [Halobiforma nitratireducens JCM 10879]
MPTRSNGPDGDGADIEPNGDAPSSERPRLGRRLEDAVRTCLRTIDDRSRLDLSPGRRRTKLDLVDIGAAFVLTVDVPGYERAELTVRLEPGRVTINGDRSGAPEGTASRDDGTSGPNGATDRRYLRRERTIRSFVRCVRLPEPIVVEAASATLVDGVLTVQLPKYEPDEPTPSDLDSE